jgi:hypothetical protein
VEFQRNTDQQLNLSNLSDVETVEDVEDVEVPERPSVMPGEIRARHAAAAIQAGCNLLGLVFWLGCQERHQNELLKMRDEAPPPTS